MKPEKMTDEDLEFELNMALSADRAARVKAHIAALTDERDHALQWMQNEATDRNNLGEQNARLLVERDALRERVHALETEKQVAWDSHAREKAARESWVEEYRDELSRREKYETRAVDTESRLAAIRQRAGTWKKHGSMEEKRALDFVLALDVAVRDPLHPCGKCTCAGEGKCGWCARYTLGGDATVAVEGVSNSPSNPEPTTAEAFATVREARRRMFKFGYLHDEQERADAALALLERRMGAMGRAIRDATMAEFTRDGGEMAVRVRHEAWDALVKASNALTDAPPVFTLEEVERLAEDHCLPGDAGRLVRAAVALRKVSR